MYLDIKITKEIYNEGTLESTETITETGNILEFVRSTTVPLTEIY